MSLGALGLYGGTPPIEYTYHLSTSNAFKTVNAAAFMTLSRYSPGRPLERDEIDGATAYLMNAYGVQAQLFVAHVTDQVASIRLHYLRPIDPVQDIAWRRQPAERTAYDLFASLFYECHQEVIRMLRHAALVEEHEPPLPPKSNLVDAFTWQAIYHPDMSDQKLAERLGVEHQSIRNARGKLGQPKRPSRGKMKAN